MVRTIPSFFDARANLLGATNQSVGFVPTMGALHEGHMSLVRAARAANDKVIASVFVNPTQFGPNEDLDQYPRQLDRDFDTLKDAGVDLVFAPNVSEIYSKDFCTFVHPVDFDDTEEGRSRPGFFRGVATVVTKLFNIVQPTRVYFGQKDAVQCCVVRRIVEDLHIPTKVVVMPTVREPDGLAMSSRNAYLSEDERAVASIVFESMLVGHQAWDEFTKGENDPSTTISSKVLRTLVENSLSSEPQISDIQYVAVDSFRNMSPATELCANESYVLSVAVKLGNVRLIDNMVLEGNEKRS